MKTRYLIAVCAVLLAVVGMTIAQQPPKVGLTPAPPSTKAIQPPPVNPKQDSPDWAGRNLTPTQDEITELRPAKPEDLTIEQLLEAVKDMRAQKAELEKKEQAFMKALTKKADKLKEQIDVLNGVMPPVSPEIPPTVVPSTSSAPALPPLPARPTKP